MNRATDRHLSTWIPLGTITPEEGGLIVLEDSHTNAELLSGYLAMDADRDGLVWLDDDPVAVQKQYGKRWLTTTFEPGDVLAFTMNTLHGALDNSSSEGKCRLSTDSRYYVDGETPDPRWNGTDVHPHGPGRVFYPGLGRWANADFQDEWKYVDEQGRLQLPNGDTPEDEAQMTLPVTDPELALAVLTDPDHPVKTATAEWARSTIDPDDMLERDRGSVFFREAWKACADEGLQGATVPTAFGGRGDDLVTAMLKLEGMGLGCRDNGLGFASGIADVELSRCDRPVRLTRVEVRDPAEGVRRVGNRSLRDHRNGLGQRHLRNGNPSQARRQRIRALGHQGTRHPRPVADYAVIFAKTNPDAGAWGISAFLVRTDQPGVELTANQDKMGLRTTPFGDISLDGYRVSEADRIGPEGAGVSIFATCMESERGLIFATQLGAAERVISEAVDRANSRSQFGQSIGTLPSGLAPASRHATPPRDGSCAALPSGRVDRPR